ncbi:MAG: SUMF1/EgtB/PvdO family nonheme iron enzyme [Planctomycetaceae bacterium]|nr:SUMF1/EgtB/PvdO family nonheme iron enzyme [Planctomycetaceae bacterium]MCA9035742.1 SUMF1/EgtB/PvdO family nonheme iron enzyme [Planctomycetaceae bacterium]
MSIGRPVIVVMLALWLTLVTSTLQAEGKRYALIVGVKTYRPGQPLPELPFPENDANGLAEVLEKGGYDVTLMTQTVGRTEGKEVFAPLSDYIRDHLSAILDNPFLKEEDVVLVALAGHGVQYELAAENGSKTPKFYFCPADADVARLKTANEITDRNRLLDLGELYTALKNCKAGGKLLLVDACRNDPTKPGVARSLASATLPPLPPPPGGTAAFFSCSAHQQAFEDKDLGHGVFFHHVIEALRGDADTSTAKRTADGQITLAELSEFVSASTYDFVRKKYQGAKQAPELKGEFRLSIPLITVARITPVPMPRPSIPTPSPSGTPGVAGLPKAAGMEFVRIEPGTFMMGSRDEGAGDNEKPHRVTISKPFYAGKYEVTVGQALAWLNSGVTIDAEWVTDGGEYSPVKQSGSRWVLNTSSKFGSSPEQPMQSISWDGAVAFCEWCTQQDAKFTYRLPTEAEWEYMARAGSTTAYPWGDSLNGREANVDGNAPYGTNTKGPYLNVTTKVGTYAPNAWGLYDTVGNVYEWCSDWYGADYYASSPERDPQGPSSGSSRVLRGGSWLNVAFNARSANRNYVTPDLRHHSIGFRVVCE